MFRFLDPQFILTNYSAALWLVKVTMQVPRASLCLTWSHRPNHMANTAQFSTTMESAVERTISGATRRRRGHE